MAATARAVDLTNVKEGGAFKPRRKPSGDYRAKIVKADDHLKEGKVPGWVLTVQIDGDARSTYPIYLSPDPKQVWKVWQVCRAAGLNVKNAKVRFDPNKLVNKAIGVYLEDDEYEGRLKSSIAESFPVSEVGGNADEDDIDTDEIIDDEEIVEDEDVEVEEEPPVPAKRRVVKKAAPEPEPEEDEEEEEEPEPTPPPRKRARKAAPPPPVEEDDEEEEEEEEAPAPPPTRRRRPKPAPVEEDLDLDDLDD
jgi:hypothetical protein